MKSPVAIASEQPTSGRLFVAYFLDTLQLPPNNYAECRSLVQFAEITNQGLPFPLSSRLMPSESLAFQEMQGK